MVQQDLRFRDCFKSLFFVIEIYAIDVPTVIR